MDELDADALSDIMTGIAVGLKAQISGLTLDQTFDLVEEHCNILPEDSLSMMLSAAEAAHEMGTGVDAWLEKKEQRDKHRSITDP